MRCDKAKYLTLIHTSFFPNHLYLIGIFISLTMSEIDLLLKSVMSSAESTRYAVDELTAHIKENRDHLPDFINKLLQKLNQKEPEGISLLSLKNDALASYINNLSLVVLSQLDRLEGGNSTHGLDHNNNSGDVDYRTEVSKQRDEAIARTIVQRVTLEKGVKPLERKINYQMENLVKAYNKTEAQQKEQERKDEKEGEEGSSSSRSSSGGDRNASNKLVASSSDDDDEEEDDDEDDEDDELAYRPDATALAKLAPKATKSKSSASAFASASSSSTEKYKPPKISAVAPPSSIREPTAKPDKTKRLQSMEEYLQEQSDLPIAEANIGSTIVGHGRGGVKTQHDRRKEKEIQAYEESNFTRLPATQTKKSFREKQRDMANQFAGEDWSIFENRDRNMSEGTSRKKRPASSWDRAKKRRSK